MGRVRPLSLGQLTKWAPTTYNLTYKQQLTDCNSVQKFYITLIGLSIQPILSQLTVFDGFLVRSLTAGFSTNPSIR